MQNQRPTMLKRIGKRILEVILVALAATLLNMSIFGAYREFKCRSTSPSAAITPAATTSFGREVQSIMVAPSGRVVA